MKHRALIIGAGRMGAGYNFGGFPFIYDHASTYLALRERVELVGFVESDGIRAKAAFEKYKLPVRESVNDALKEFKPSIVSDCTNPNQRVAIYECKINDHGVKAIWCEKPLADKVEVMRTYIHWMEERTIMVQVNYCRRFDRTHQAVAELLKGKKSTLSVWARNDETTRCHFTDLARWWGSELIYTDNTGESPSTNSYAVDTGKWRMEFRNGGVQGDFMIDALRNLLDVVDGVPGAKLLSPPYPMENA